MKFSWLDKMPSLLERRIRILHSGQECVVCPRTPAYRLLPTTPKHAHAHTRPEVFIQIRGVSHMHFPEEIIHLRPGQILVVPPGYYHAEIPEPSHSFFINYVIAYGPNSFSCHVGLTTKDRIQVEDYRIMIPEKAGWQTKKIQQLCFYLHEVVKRYQGSSEVLPINWLMALHLWVLLEEIRNRSSQEKAYPPLIFRALQLIHECLTNPQLDVSWLAERLHCSADYLSHTFRSFLNIRLTHYIQQERIGLARQFLEKGDLSLEKIAYQCGFRNRVTFHRVFSRVMGCTPQEYYRLFHHVSLFPLMLNSSPKTEFPTLTHAYLGR